MYYITNLFGWFPTHSRNNVIESHSLTLSNLQFSFCRVALGKGASSPWRSYKDNIVYCRDNEGLLTIVGLTSMNFIYRLEPVESCSVPKRNVNDTVMCKGRKKVHNSSFLTSTGSSSRYKHASIFSVKSALLPKTASGIPECLLFTKYARINE